MKRRSTIKIIASLMCIITLLSGCGGKGSADISTLNKDMLAADTELPKMNTVSSDSNDAEINFTLLCDFSYDDVAEYYYSYSDDGSAPEMAVVRLKDAADASTLMRSIKDHVALRSDAMREYSPEEQAMVDNYILTHEGAYVCYIVSPKNGVVQKVFDEAMGEK